MDDASTPRIDQAISCTASARPRATASAASPANAMLTSPTVSAPPSLCQPSSTACAWMTASAPCTASARATPGASAPAPRTGTAPASPTRTTGRVSFSLPLNVFHIKLYYLFVSSVAELDPDEYDITLDMADYEDEFAG